MNKVLKESDIIGKKGICHDCGKEGTWELEPYHFEIHDERYLICLCAECYRARFENI